MITWVDRGGVVHSVAMARPKDGARMTEVTRCDGTRIVRREKRRDLNPTCIDCILEEE